MQNKKWTEEEDRMVLNTIDLHETAKRLGRTYGGCFDRRYKLRKGGAVKKKERVDGWSEYETRCLIQWVDAKVRTKDIAEELGRSVDAINARKQVLGLTKKYQDVFEIIEPEKPVHTGKFNAWGRDVMIKDPDRYWREAMRRVG